MTRLETLLTVALAAASLGLVTITLADQQHEPGIHIRVSGPERAKQIATALEPFNEPGLDCLEYEVSTSTLQTCEPETGDE
jgi:hypothetical protein